MTLTPRQKSVLDCIRAHQQDEGMAPTVREICAHLGLKGPAGVHRILHVLVDKGYLQAAPGRKRSWRLTTGHGKTLPIIGLIAAGDPIEAVENPEEKLPLDPALFGYDNCFALRVQGDSMINAHIVDGDIAVIRPQKVAENGQIVAVMVDDILPEATLKILQRRRGVTELLPANTLYAPLVFKGRAQKRIRIIGKFVGIIRRS